MSWAIIELDWPDNREDQLCPRIEVKDLEVVLPCCDRKQAEARATALLAVANEFCDEYGYCVPPDEGCGTPTCDALRALAATGDWWKRPPTGEE